MDKLAPAIAWTKENGFWLANGLLLLLMGGLWYLVTSGLNAEKEKNVGTIKKETNLVQAIMQKKPEDLLEVDVSLHPNRTTKEGMQKELERTVDSIIAAWKLRVAAQKKLLVFPAVIGNEKFAKVFAPYNPPETFPVEYADIRTIDALLSLYRVRIQKHMINLCGKDGVRTNWLWDPANYPQDEDVNSRRRQSTGGYDDYGDDGGGGLAMEVKDEDASRFAVLWSEVNQQLWYDKLTKFRDRDDHNKESNDPTPLQCYMLQQDLWVLEAMFDVIKDLNGDSSATDTSAIKQIDHIGIGREGTAQLGKLHAVDSRFASQVDTEAEVVEDFGYDDGGYGDEGYGSGGSTTGGSKYELVFSEEEAVVGDDGGYGDGGYDDSGYGAELGGTTERLPPFHEMYVDTKFEPISSEEVLKVVRGEELSESNLELLIAKRLPVRIGLKMDERKIPDFMAACINSPFSFEIQQVRINRHRAGGELIALGGGKAAVAGGYGLLEDAANKFDEVSSVETRVNYDVHVEFFGIIKIYNPVRADLIRKAAGLDPAEPAPGGDPDPADSAAIRDSSSTSSIAG